MEKIVSLLRIREANSSVGSLLSLQNFSFLYFSWMQQAMENREVGGYGGFDTEQYEGEEERDDPYSLPLGWRFCPTDVELITNYLRPKVRRRKLPVEGLILDADLYADNPAGLTG